MDPVEEKQFSVDTVYRVLKSLQIKNPINTPEQAEFMINRLEKTIEVLAMLRGMLKWEEELSDVGIEMYTIDSWELHRYSNVDQTKTIIFLNALQELGVCKREKEKRSKYIFNTRFSKCLIGLIK
ncbi:MAG TPA: hypothetical protein VMW95_03725 [Desulfobacterales bacterium]|nr:hypothetical protein [Desulfobacterales bacterium]